MKKSFLRINQSGAALIAVIAAIVIGATIVAAMLSYSTTSSMGELFANKQQKAYYIAESGINYALQRYIASPVTNGPFPTLTTFTLTDGSFAVKTFDKAGDATHLIIEATGTTGSGWLQTSQYITKDITKATAAPAGIPPTTSTPDPVTGAPVPIGFDTNTNSVLDTTWTVAPGTSTTDVSVTDGNLSLKGTTEAIQLNQTLVGITTDFTNNGNLLSYLAQVKSDLSKMSPGKYFMSGISFRVRENAQADCYGLSYYRSEGITGPTTWYRTTAFDGIKNNLATDGTIYAVIWKRISGIYTLLAYERMDNAAYSYGTLSGGLLVPWSTLLVSVNERFDASGNRANYIKAYVQSPSHPVTGDYPLYPKGTINWLLSNFKPVHWTSVNGTQILNGTQIVDSSITSNTFTSYSSEIGIHGFYDSSGSGADVLGDFSSAIQGTTGGSVVY